MASYNRLVENYERREKELNATLVAFYLQAGHLVLSGKTDLKDDEYSRPYELIAGEISNINEQCREISASEQKKITLEKTVQTLRKAILDYEPEKRRRYIELGNYLFTNYTQHLASTFGTVYSPLRDEKKYIDVLEKNLADLAIQMEKKDFFSKLVLKVKQSSLESQLSSRQRKIENLMAEGAEKAFRAGAVSTENGGTAYSACRILQDEIASVNAKLEDTLSEVAKVSEKLKETDKKGRLLAAAAEKAGELDKIAEKAGIKLVNKYVSDEAKILGEFPESYARIFKDVVDTRRELCSIARRKEMLRCTEQMENAAESMSVMQKELDANNADIERLTKRNEELSERIASAAAAVDSIKQRKVALEVVEGISVNRLLGVVTEVANATSAENTSATSSAESAPAGGTSVSDSASVIVGEGATGAESANNAADGAVVGSAAPAADGTSKARDSDSPAADNTAVPPAEAPKPKRTYKKRTPKAEKSAADGEKASPDAKAKDDKAASPAEKKAKGDASTGSTEAPKPKRTYKKRAPKTAQPTADGEKASSDTKAAAKKGKADKATKNGKDQSKLKNTKPNGEVSTST